MRSEIFLLGIIMVIIGPVLVALAFSSCLGTILSGNVFACIGDFPYVVIGGVFFVAGIITALVGLVAPESVASARPNWSTPAQSFPAGPQATCRKCGRVYDLGQFFCPACGQPRG